MLKKVNNPKNKLITFRTTERIKQKLLKIATIENKFLSEVIELLLIKKITEYEENKNDKKK